MIPNRGPSGLVTILGMREPEARTAAGVMKPVGRKARGRGTGGSPDAESYVQLPVNKYPPSRASPDRTSAVTSRIGLGRSGRLAARFGRIDRSIERSPCALRCDRPKHRRASLRASVSSDRSAQDPAR
jgi:hypothetical protein